MHSRVLLTSTSAVKLKAFNTAFGFEPKTRISVDDCGNPEQPVGYLETLICCKRRIEHVLLRTNQINVRDYDMILSIENGIQQSAKGYHYKDAKCFDVVHVVCYDTTSSMYAHYSGSRFQFENSLWKETRDLPNNVKTTLGWSITIGDVVAEKFGYDKKNWIKDYNAFGAAVDRVEQIASVLLYIQKLQGQSQLIHHRKDCVEINIRYAVDHPKPGIIFQDLSPVWANSKTNKTFFSLLEEEVENSFLTDDTKIDVVVGLESRGFGIGHGLANAIGAGFVMVRKPKKLIGDVWSETYNKEYGTDTVELQKDVIPAGSNVLIVDDLIATGGSLEAAVKLVKNVKDVNILGCLTCLKVEPLFEEAEKKIMTAGAPKVVTIF